MADTPAIVMNFDEMTWAVALRYNNISMDDALAIIKLMRSMNYKFLQTLTAQEWQKTGTHSLRGVLSLEMLMQGYAEHIDRHIAQINRNLQSLKQSRSV